ncbi:Excinuclease ABC subunit A [Candidatus Ornithobacterium hominis]|uniref:excinuclease ABC subunit UvrA n=1 Tax=Candidatus Ornithobacterium hominis TaxID=2497989 RepID=UPI000E5AF50C|nr:excinuclease ABC subunit UvrA [Candidatus Ornithobacterium hominis]SZD73363.1 Excinuclease ABC subunit A [Candidatus Ornithobacterium hominis]
MPKSAETFNSKKHIQIEGAKLHNLKNIHLTLPKNKLIVITGLSGSGKSSLAFDTLYAEGQRRYVESLSSYARQFLGRLDKPQVDQIRGIAPAIAIQQKVNSVNPRSTVGTSTEIYDYLKLLFARIGETYSPVSGKKVTKDTVTDVVNYIQSLPENTNVNIISPLLIPEERDFQQQLDVLQKQGFARVDIDGNTQKIQDLIDFSFQPQENMKLNLVIDRVVTKNDEDFYHRLADSIQTAFYEGHGEMMVHLPDGNKEQVFSNKFELDGISFIEPSLHFFSFNNPLGACPTCEGYGKILGIDENLVVPNKNLSIYEDAVAAWKGDKMSEWKKELIRAAEKLDFPIHKAYYQLSPAQKKTLWDGQGTWQGINGFFQMLEENTYKIQYRVMLARYRGKTTCPSCQGKRLKKETDYVKISQKNISDLVDLPLNELQEFFKALEISEHQKKVAKRILLEIESRIQFLLDVGLNYLTLNRTSNTLSGGESQRINLATSLGSSLVGSMYILDEPSIGLHSRDTANLIKVLLKLRDLGNTVIVVEHDEDVMKAADFIVDIGPEAGSNGGEVVFAGTYDELLKTETLTAQYLNGKREIPVPRERATLHDFVEVTGAREHNLKNITARLPLHAMAVITGVSGSGKSTLIQDIFAPAIERELEIYSQNIGDFEKIQGAVKQIKALEYIDQNPIGKSSRSNPVTYIKVYDDIRKLFAEQKLSKMRGYKTKHFSFNVEGGRCEVCQGEGSITIEMQFMADVTIECDQCHGTRFKDEILDVKFAGKNISDVLHLTVDDAIEFFKENQQSKIAEKLQSLQDVGLGYVQLGQSSSTLSGGEAQRIKLASFLTKGNNAKKTLFIFDEPSTGLHFHDVQKLLISLRALIENGHSVWVIEHHPDIIKSADYLLDLGPEGGKQGGEIVASGTPEEIIKVKKSHTSKYLAEKLKI